uniref:small monomeric GTPase n=1 Tax=Salarias fasciatus TaxID=181472 RepID=A0A672FXM9_SALFA
MVVEERRVVEVTEANQQRVEVNILLLGAHNVGKSALTVRFLTRRFIGSPSSSLESVYSRVDRVNGQEISFNIWDSQYTQLSEKCVSTSDKQLQWSGSSCSGSAAAGIAERARGHRGNKRDLRSHRSVSGEEGRLLALSRAAASSRCRRPRRTTALLVFHRLVDLVAESRALRKSTAGVRGIVRGHLFGRWVYTKVGQRKVAGMKSFRVKSVGSS